MRHLPWLGAALAAAACAGATAASTATSTPTSPTTGPSGSGGVSTSAIYSQFGKAATVTLDAATVTIRTTDVPDHPSPYWGAGNALYEAPQGGMTPNGFTLTPQNLVFRIPLAPAAMTPSDTPLGAIGVAVNGVALYNQYAAGRQPLGPEIFSFDRYNGHPTPNQQYHYHFEPLWITAASKSRLIGVLLDGFPVYGPQDADGHTPSDLDSCHGHTTATPEFPSGIYHYHTADTAPYISGCFRGTPGTVG
jgi:YHYH protein